MLTKRFVHQDYYHPHDVPIYQTPSLGDGGKTEPNVSPEDFIYPLMNIDFREPIDFKFECKEQGFPNYTISQSPEMFLPEEPTFLEFWGFYPFAFFLGCFALSREYFILLGSGHTSIVFIATGVLVIIILIQTLTKSLSIENQFMVDQDWCALSTFRWSLEKSISNFQENLKTKSRAKKFADYNKQLIKYKTAYFAHVRKKQFTEKILNKLKLIQAAEEFYMDNVNKEDKKNLEEFKKKFSVDKEYQKEWEKFAMLALRDANKKGVHDNWPDIEAKINAFIEEKKNQKKEMSGKETAVDHFIATHLKKIYDNLADLKIYDGPRKSAEKYIPKNLGIVGELTEEEKEQLVQKDSIKKGKLRIVKEQIARFIEGMAPKSLIRLLKKIENE